jgi:hypothetical protein
MIIALSYAAALVFGVGFFALLKRPEREPEHQIPDLEGDYRRAYKDHQDAKNRRDCRDIHSTWKALRDAQNAQLRGGR